MGNRGYEEREMRLALEWAHLTYPEGRVISRYRILTGPLPTIPGLTEAQVRGALKVTGLMADLVIQLPDRVFVVEAKTDNETQAIGQLLYYVDLMRKNPQLQDVPVDNLVPVILLARETPEIREFANALGVVVKTYTPDWIRPFLEKGYT